MGEVRWREGGEVCVCVLLFLLWGLRSWYCVDFRGALQ